MQESSFDLLRFRRCHDLHGNTVHVTVGRRNGKPAAFIRPFSEDPLTAPEPQAFTEQPKLFINLNPIESETWRRLLMGHSIASIAREQGISRAAIYSRIQGNSQGQGGMIAKNFWVLLWWRLRQRLLTPAIHD